MQAHPDSPLSAKISIPLDKPTYERLIAQAVAARRPLVWRASVLLRQAVGPPFPGPEPDELGTEAAGCKEARDEHTPQ